MKTRPLLLALSLILVGSAAAAAPDQQSASGAAKGHMMNTFSATLRADGTASGQMTFLFRDAQKGTTNGTSIHADVKCASFGPVTIFDFQGQPVHGQGASIYGVVTRTDNPNSHVGDPIEIEVVDVGPASPGHQPGPDWTSTILTNPPPDWIQQQGVVPNCTFDSPDKFPVRDGNVTITS
jgi:hypothetical protein